MGNKEKVMMDTPVGKLAVRDSIIKENKNLTDKELIEKFYKKNKNSRFVDLELLALLRNRNIYIDYLNYERKKEEF